MFEELLKARKIPEILSREEMLDILQREEYGYLPARPDAISFQVTPNIVSNFCAGKAELSRVQIDCSIKSKSFSFPVYAAVPTKAGKYPFFVHINFRDCVPDRYMPTEELIDNGFAVLSFCYEDVTSDNGDFTNGLAGVLYEDGKRSPTDPGKIAMWAWAAQRVLDYAQTLEKLDLDCAVVCGHSRLGKTALLAGATDQRFKFAYSNDSGCSGAAITRGKIGETVSAICSVFPFWFCENYKKYMDDSCAMPFDQHYLTACIAPRYVCIGSAVEDTWADPTSEMLNCVAVSSVYDQYHMPGFIYEDREVVPGDAFFAGSVGYHMRSGSHYFSREDWQRLIQFVNMHR